jgi:fructose/tagatose bisphosphate aldolase
LPERPSFTPECTDVTDVVRFVEAVSIDMLAVSIGSIHGVYEIQDALDFDRLEAIRNATSLPLVMHGTSGISLENAGCLARAGMAKINYGEPFRYNYIRYFNKLSDEMEHLWHSWKVMQAVKDRLKADMKSIISALGAEGKA